MTEQQRSRDETETPSEEDEVEAVTHTTPNGRDEAALHADTLAEEDAERYGLRKRDLRVAAHESVMEDWAENHDDKPAAIRPVVWLDPFTPATPINETERRFLHERRGRERTLAHKRGESR